MYIVIYDKGVIRGNEQNKILLYHESYAAFKEMYNEELSLNDLEGIIVYSIIKEDYLLKAKFCKCNGILSYENGMAFELGTITELDATCEEVRKRLYGFLVRNKIIGESKLMNRCYILYNEGDYSYLIGEKRQSVYRSLMQRIEDYKRDNNWDKIIEEFGDRHNLCNTEFWNSNKCLSELAFALQKKISKDKRPFTKDDDYFKLVIDRAIEIAPESVKDISTKAYYYYHKYITFKKQEDYERANEIYLELINISNERYKEFYRYTTLNDYHFMNLRYTMDGVSNKKIANEIRTNYINLVISYDDLEEYQRIKYKKLYAKSLYSYSSFELDNYLDYWRMYFEHQIYNKDYWRLMFENKKYEEINQVDDYISKFIEVSDTSIATIDNIQENPGYFHAHYRLAQVKQIKGIIYYIKNKKDESVKFFEESNEIINKIFTVANEYRKNDKNRFNYPNYARSVRAINYYFIGDYERAHDSFGFKLRPYQMYEDAQIYLLQGEKDKAKERLNNIPKDDTCYNKANKLMEKINEM